MKPFIALLLPATLYASEPTELEYKTAFLWNWVTACAQIMAPQFERQGMPRHFAQTHAVEGCSCVIDRFRANYLFTDVVKLTVDERRAAGAQFAEQCEKGEIRL